MLDEKDDLLIQRAYRAFNHAKHRQDNCQNEYDRIDLLLALKRAMHTRLEHLNSLYNFQQYPSARSNGWLSVLEDWGTIRQRTLRRLNRLRNSVEHDGAEPADLDTCEDFLEITWWFLEHTNQLLTPLTDYCLVGDAGTINCDIDLNPASVELWGTVSPEVLSDKMVDGWSEMVMLPAMATVHSNWSAGLVRALI